MYFVAFFRFPEKGVLRNPLTQGVEAAVHPDPQPLDRYDLTAPAWA